MNRKLREAPSCKRPGTHPEAVAGVPRPPAAETAKISTAEAREVIIPQLPRDMKAVLFSYEVALGGAKL